FNPYAPPVLGITPALHETVALQLVYQRRDRRLRQSRGLCDGARQHLALASDDLQDDELRRRQPRLAGEEPRVQLCRSQDAAQRDQRAIGTIFHRRILRCCSPGEEHHRANSSLSQIPSPLASSERARASIYFGILSNFPDIFE